MLVIAMVPVFVGRTVREIVCVNRWKMECNLQRSQVKVTRVSPKALVLAFRSLVFRKGRRVFSKLHVLLV